MITMILGRGAEAVVELRDNRVVKTRVEKGYRVDRLDRRLRGERTRSEARLIHEARRAGVPTPIVFDVDEYSLTMEYIRGEPLKHVLTTRLSRRVGVLVGRLHSADIIHGDLTTSNMILTPNDRIYFIDFGLAYVDPEVEAKGVDVHVLFETYESTHEDHPRHIEAFKRGYGESYAEAEEVFERIREIESRGRYL